MISNSVETASLTPREIFYGATKDVSFEEAVGKNSCRKRNSLSSGYSYCCNGSDNKAGTH